MPRLQAERAPVAAHVALLPHYSGTKNDKRAGERIRARIINAWRALVHPSRDGEPEYDKMGRKILRNYQQVASLFRQ